MEEWSVKLQKAQEDIGNDLARAAVYMDEKEAQEKVQ